MNLKHYLILRVILIALLCLLITAGYVLHSNHQQSRTEARLITESVAKQLEFQLLRIDAGFGQPEKFPDFDLWQQTTNVAGVCLQYVVIKLGQPRTICNGSQFLKPVWPTPFARLYRWLYQPDKEWIQAIRFKGVAYGELHVAQSAELATARAWENLCQLIGLSFVTLVAVCTLIYLSLSRALRPAQAITSVLQKIRSGDLGCRLPDFAILEWQQTATAINQLLCSQQQLLNERQQLALQLMTVQEEERRFLARELHDELGQCLTAINALALSIRQTAQQQCPVLVSEAQQISHITQHVMQNVRSLLLRLRPVEVDELGLAASLASLIAEWNGTSNDGCRYRLAIEGDCAQLPEPLPVTIYRIIQECLTNITKHANASHADVNLNISTDKVQLVVTDNGKGKHAAILNGNGMGLLGIRERVTGIGGRVVLKNADPNGFIVECWLPINK